MRSGRYGSMRPMADWDVSKEIAQLDGPFEPGACGWAKQRGNLGGTFTVTVVDTGAALGYRMPGAAGQGHLRAPA